jgi:hypothetical protein
MLVAVGVGGSVDLADTENGDLGIGAVVMVAS